MYVEYKPGNAKPAYIRRETKLDMQEPQPEKLKSKLSFTLYSMTLFSEHSYFLSYLPYLPSPPHGADQGDLCTMQARKAYGSCDLCHCRLSHFGGDSGHHARHAIWRCWYASSPLPVPSTSYLMPCRRHRAWSSFHRSHRRRSHDTEIQ